MRKLFRNLPLRARQHIVSGLVCIIVAAGVSACGEGNKRQYSIAVLGDEYTAGNGLAGDKTLSAQIQNALTAQSIPSTVTNYSHPELLLGDAITLASVVAKQKHNIVIVALGMNDLRRGISVAQMEEDLGKIIHTLRVAGAQVIVAGFKAPLNVGPTVGSAFNAMYPSLASKHEAQVMAYYMKDVSGSPELTTRDGLPNAEGIATITKNLMPILKKSVQKIGRL